MTLSLDKKTWKRVTLGEVARHVTDRVDAETSGLKQFLAGEHIPSNSLRIEAWGVVGRDPIGPMFYKRFKPGHVLYVSRRTYLRKVGVPEFEGITGEKTFVLESLDDGILLQAYLPFVLSAEVFHGYAVANSRGSVNPYLNWGELAAYEFDMPPIDEQQRLADLLWAVEAERRSVRRLHAEVGVVRAAMVDRFLATSGVPQGSIESVLSSLKDGPFGSKIKSEHYADEGVRVLRLKDVQVGQITDEDVALLRADHVHASLPGYQVAGGDVVVAGLGDEAHPVGRAALVTEAVAGSVHKADIFRLVVDRKCVRPEYLVEALNSTFVRPGIAARSQGTTRLRINTTNLRKVRVPVPPLESQDEILAHLQAVDHALSDLNEQAGSLVDLASALSSEIFGDE